MILTRDDIINYIKAKWPRASCLRCGSNMWNMGENEIISGFLPIGGSEMVSIMQTSSHLPVVWMVCRNCGSVDYISQKAIERWRAAPK